MSGLAVAEPILLRSTDFCAEWPNGRDFSNASRDIETSGAMKAEMALRGLQLRKILARRECSSRAWPWPPEGKLRALS